MWCLSTRQRLSSLKSVQRVNDEVERKCYIVDLKTSPCIMFDLNIMAMVLHRKNCIKMSPLPCIRRAAWRRGVANAHVDLDACHLDVLIGCVSLGCADWMLVTWMC